SGIGAGTRRIEAVTGEAAYTLMNNELEKLQQIHGLLKAKPHEVVNRTESMLAEVKELHREKESLISKLANIEAGSILDDVKEINGVKVLAHEVASADMNTLRNMADDLKQKIESGIIVLGSGQEGKVNLIAAVTKDLISDGYHAGKLI